jgi:8-oxo-dGTP pyrophosphatase MutT (NUDIX family)
MASAVDRLLRIALTAVHKLLKAGWFLRRPRTYGAHAIALTPEGRLILVKLRYAPGWRLPGGGRSRAEEPRAAALRELREEIGMKSHGEVRLACELEEEIDCKRDLASLVVVRDVRYRPKWNWEVERVAEFAMDSLPADLSMPTRRWLDLVEESL